MKPSLVKIGLTPREQLNAAVVMAAAAFGCAPADVLARTRQRAADMARLDVYHQLAILGWSRGKIARVTGRDKKAVIYALHKPRPTPVSTVRATDADLHELALLRAAVSQWTGQEIAYRIAQRFDLKLGAASIFAIVIAAYPRALNYDQLLERYETGREDMGLSAEIESAADLIKGSVSKVRRAFAAEGLPNPIITIQPRGLRLNEEVSAWIAHAFDVPQMTVNSYSPHRYRTQISSVG